MGYRVMQDKQKRIYGARVRLGWFKEAERKHSVTEACRLGGIPKSTYYYWHKKWVEGGKKLETLMDEPKSPKSHKNDPDEELASLVVQLRLGLMYGEYALSVILTTLKFIKMAIRFYKPAFEIKLIQTDNGPEFTNAKYHTDSKKIPPLSLPEKWLIKHNIGFRHIPPSSPHLNGRIERPHGVDKWRYSKMTSASHKFKELVEFCQEDCLDYNTYRPHSMLENKTPVEFLQSLEGYEKACPDFSVVYETVIY